MGRIVPGTPLPWAPLVAQNRVLLPDGSIDPDHATDCGESCVSSVITANTSYTLTPGCIRQAMQLNRDSGITTANDLWQFLHAMGINAFRVEQPAANEWASLNELRHHGKYRILLGSWESPDFLHWVVAFEKSSGGIKYMDPWNGTYGYMDLSRFREQYALAAVVANLWRPV